MSLASLTTPRVRRWAWWTAGVATLFGALVVAALIYGRYCFSAACGSVLLPEWWSTDTQTCVELVQCIHPIGLEPELSSSALAESCYGPRPRPPHARVLLSVCRFGRDFELRRASPGDCAPSKEDFLLVQRREAERACADRRCGPVDEPPP